VSEAGAAARTTAQRDDRSCECDTEHPAERRGAREVRRWDLHWASYRSSSAEVGIDRAPLSRRASERELVMWSTAPV
jgi:hypothetical protein